jgi:putative RNA 2'-phosphotransferase
VDESDRKHRRIDVANPEERKRLSKYMSKVLRHEPEKAGLTLDERGFCPIEDLLRAASQALRREILREDLLELTRPQEDPAQKLRFEAEGDFVRAGHGHSIPVAGYRETAPRGNLFHATTRGALDSIREGGLKAMNRQKVHLAYDRGITLEAARRKNRDVVCIEIDAARARERGVKFYESADPRIVLSDDIPPDCLLPSDSDGCARTL